MALLLIYTALQKPQHNIQVNVTTNRCIKYNIVKKLKDTKHLHVNKLDVKIFYGRWTSLIALIGWLGQQGCVCRQLPVQ